MVQRKSTGPPLSPVAAFNLSISNVMTDNSACDVHALLQCDEPRGPPTRPRDIVTNQVVTFAVVT